MSDTRSGREMTKADVILTKLDQINRRIGSLESRIAAQKKEKDAAAAPTTTTAVIDGDVIKKLADEHEQLKLEISCVSMQIEGLYTTLSKLINKLPEQIAAKMPEPVVASSSEGEPAPVVTQVVNNPVEFDVDDLASRVAAKIIIPDNGLEDFDAEALAEKINSLAAAPAAVAASPVNIDYDELGYAVAKRMYIPQAVTEEIDYDKLAKEVTGKMPAVNIDYEELGYSVAKKMFIPQAVAEEFDYDAIADRIAQKMPAPTFNIAAAETAVAAAEPVEAEPVSVQAEIDYDLLAAKVAEAVSVQEPVSADYIAARVAEQIIIPQTVSSSEPVDLDVEELSRKVADKIVIPAYHTEPALSEEKIAEAVAERLREDTAEATPAAVEANLDEEALAEGIAARLNFSLSDELIADAVVKNLSGAIDSDEIADCVAKRVGSISPEQFEITVDDDGCDSLAKAVESKLDYDVIAAAVAEKLNPAFMSSGSGEEIDTDELARAISEKLSVNADINEDLLADKAAAVLSNYMPEIDSADIADKVIAGIIPALPSTPVIDSESIANSVSEKLVIDNEGIADSVSERIVESQENNDYDIVIDEEGLNRITESISEEITKENDERYAKLEEEYGKRLDKFDGDVEEIKEEYGKRFDKIDEDVAEIKEMLLSGIVVAAGVAETAAAEAVEEVEEEEEEVVEEELVTVSDLVGEEEAEEEVVEEEVVEEPVEEVVEEEPVVEEQPEEEPEPVEEEEEAEEEPDQIEELVEEIDENLADDEIMPDGMEGGFGGIDFANMMKYNRSFIARIIQGTDDQKAYYGQVKTALLSYKKVNSNVAWAAERFNKGRETIARFKIRGKTLCLYLALDPDEYATSVYHHADVSDNKSMHGTPMMVKIKSQLGVKKAIRLIDEMLAKRNGEKHVIAERDYAAMYPYETIEELIEDGLVKDVRKS
ncbi:MAG: hypothetical protein K2O44_00630 [Clostridia bacterium]|nr:hypothetical protein [Clostridia bacterium]